MTLCLWQRFCLNISNGGQCNFRCYNSQFTFNAMRTYLLDFMHGLSHTIFTIDIITEVSLESRLGGFPVKVKEN